MALPATAVLAQSLQLFGEINNELKRIPDSVRGFVDAFNPQAGLRLDFAFQSLNATIGGAFVPIIEGAARIVERFADAISNGMGRLQAPIEKAVGLFMGVLQPALVAVSDVFDGLADAADLLSPLMEPAAAALEAMTALSRVLTTIGVQALLEAIKLLIPNAESLTEITTAVTQAFVQLTETTLRLAQFMLGVVGLNGAMEKILTRLAKEPEMGDRRKPAPTNFGIGGLEDIYRRRLVEAAKAGGKTPEEQSRDYLADIRKIAAEMLKELQANPNAAKEKAEGAARDAAWGAGEAALGIPVFEWMWRQIRQGDRNRR